MPHRKASSDSDSSFATARRRLDVAEVRRVAGAAEHEAGDVNMRSLVPSDSPCVAVCSTLYDEICRGCGRTAMEVANWVFLDDDEKLQVWQRIRAQGYPRRKG